MVSMNLPMIIAIINGIEPFWSYAKRRLQNSMGSHEKLLIYT